MRKFIAIAMFSLFLVPCFAMAQLTPQETGLEITGEQAYGSVAPSIGVWVGAKIITPALALVGVVFIILMIYAGFLWMTAGGKP
ncbi:hypothetical protein KJ673_01055, partial [Patescibacteria group bacterium]|nr:hypothetical protein [Patescibacteria group bacterium]